MLVQGERVDGRVEGMQMRTVHGGSGERHVHGVDGGDGMGRQVGQNIARTLVLMLLRRETIELPALTLQLAHQLLCIGGHGADDRR